MPPETQNNLKKFARIYNEIDNKITQEVQDERIEKLRDEPHHRDYMMLTRDGGINRQSLPHLKLPSQPGIPPKSALTSLSLPNENNNLKRTTPKNRLIELLYGNDRQFINPDLALPTVPTSPNSLNKKKRIETSKSINKEELSLNNVNWTSVKVKKMAISLNESKIQDLLIKGRTTKSQFLFKNLNEFLVPLEEIDHKNNSSNRYYQNDSKSPDDSKNNNDSKDPEKNDIPINNYLLTNEPIRGSTDNIFLSSKNYSVDRDEFLKSRDHEIINNPNIKGMKNFRKNFADFTNSNYKIVNNSIVSQELSKFSTTFSSSNLRSTKNKSTLNTVYIEDDHNNIIPIPQDTRYSLPFADKIISNSFHRPQALIRPQIMKGAEIAKESSLSPLRKNPQPYNTSMNFFKRYEHNRQAAKFYKDKDNEKNRAQTASLPPQEIPRCSTSHQLIFPVKNTIPAMFK